jgi:hypothetical protein
LVLELVGPASVLASIEPQLAASFAIAPTEEVVANAKSAFESDPSLLVLAAWVTPAGMPALSELLESASRHRKPEVRGAVVRAASIWATPTLRTLAEKMTSAEKDKKLAVYMRTVLDGWPKEPPADAAKPLRVQKPERPAPAPFDPEKSPQYHALRARQQFTGAEEVVSASLWRRRRSAN